MSLKKMRVEDPAAYRARMAEYQRNWRKANPERSKANNARAREALLLARREKNDG